MPKSPPCHGADTKTADAEGADAEPEGPEEQEPRPPRPRSSSMVVVTWVAGGPPRVKWPEINGFHWVCSSFMGPISSWMCCVVQKIKDQFYQNP